MSGFVLGGHRRGGGTTPPPPRWNRTLPTGLAESKTPVIFAGHGSFNTITDRDQPKVRLPANVTMVFWCHHGEELMNSIGVFIEQNKPLSELPDHLKDVARRNGYDPAEIPEIVPGGSEIWNYRLTYPKGLDLGARPLTYTQPPMIGPVQNPETFGASEGANYTTTAAIRDSHYCIVGPWEGSDVKQRGLPILAMIAANMEICRNNIVHWCACRSIVDR